MLKRFLLVASGVMGLGALVTLALVLPVRADSILFGSLPEPQRQAAPTLFMYPPYFGTTWVTSVYDHEYPEYNKEALRGRNNPTRTFEITSTVIHYDGSRQHRSYSGHNGIDYGLRYEYVLSAHDGEVRRAAWASDNHRSGYGLFIRVCHDTTTYCTVYGHLSSLFVEQGDMVSASDVLGISGNTGTSTGPHLHFEAEPKENDRSVNPYGWTGAYTDPWENAEGLVSHNLWSHFPSISNTDAYTDGEELLLSDSQDPRLTPQTTITGTVTIDDDDPTQFTTRGTWTEATACDCTDCSGCTFHGETFRYAVVTTTNTATWQPAAGTLRVADYDVYAYIPSAVSDNPDVLENQVISTTQAYYTIHHNGGDDPAGAAIGHVHFPRKAGDRNWAYLGRYGFIGDGNEYVTVVGEAPGRVAADALMLVPVGDTDSDPEWLSVCSSCSNQGWDQSNVWSVAQVQQAIDVAQSQLEQAQPGTFSSVYRAAESHPIKPDSDTYCPPTGERDNQHQAI